MNGKAISWVANKPIDLQIVLDLTNQCAETHTFTNYGPITQQLEQHITELLKIQKDKKCVIAVANATVALWALVDSVRIFTGLEENMKVITQAFTFPSCCQGRLSDTIIVDINDMSDSKHFGVGPSFRQIQEALPFDLLIITNIFGHIVDIDMYEKWCQEHNVILIQDNAATPYTSYKGLNVNNYGTGSIVSFHHTKPIGFGEGGCVIVDKELESIVRKLINFGYDKKDPNCQWHKYGSNYKISEIASIYILQHNTYTNFNAIVEKHNRLYRRVKEKCENLQNDCIRMFPNMMNSTGASAIDVSFYLPACFPLIFSTEEIANGVRDVLLQNGIFCKKYYKPLDMSKNNSVILYNRILCIPCNIDMIEPDIDRIFSLIELVIQSSGEIVNHSS